jgi:MtrB/PioB family decaheme-associated outer membrane protein
MRSFALAAAIVLAAAGEVLAQPPASQSGTPPAQPAGGDAGTETPSPLTIDIGYRASTVDGDRARFERYQDLRKNGLNLNVFGSGSGEGWAVDFGARNVGYHDQQYDASINARGKLRAQVGFFQLPLNYGFAEDGFVQTPYTAGLLLDDATQAAAQLGRAVAWTANPTQTSAWVAQAHPIDLASRRSQLDASLVYSPVPSLDVNAAVRTYSRTGSQPWGASWGFSQAAELPLALDNRTTDFTVGAEWARTRGGVQLSLDNSTFTNDSDVLTWDNPQASTDSLTRGAARGLMAVMPGNSMTTFRGAGVLHLPARSHVTAAFAVSRLDQDAALVPVTSNTLLGAPAPTRASAQAKADVSMVNLAFNSRPAPKLWLTGRFRYRDFTQTTPEYLGAVALFDTSITQEDSVEPSEYLDYTSQDLQLAASYAVMRYATVRFDYLHHKLDQTLREWPTVNEHVERVSLDSVGSAWVSLRATYEHATRRGSGTYEIPDGHQPANRMFDDADRTRNRGIVMLTVTPASMVGFTFTANAGKDAYDDPEQRFGMLNNDNQAYTAGVDVTPSDGVSAGVAYGYEKYSALSASRNANPPPDPTFSDPARDWTHDQVEHVHTVTANLTLTRLAPNAEVLFGYDYSHSDQSYLYSGPAITRLQGLPAAAYAIGFSGQFGQLPNVIDTVNRATVNVRYFFTRRLAANLTYWFDKYTVEDFATPTRLDLPGSLLLGYGSRPDTAHTVFLNALYRF